MDWFSDIVGFTEGAYEATQRRLTLTAGQLVSDASPRRPKVGTLTFPSLRELRAQSIPDSRRSSSVSPLSGEARALHRDSQFNGALFQVASQFNLLEMSSPALTPEDGVTRYQGDHTQGPACAMATGAATIYRNYLVPVDGVPGQTRHRQLNMLDDVGAALAEGTGLAPHDLWDMINGYALCSPTGLTAIARFLDGLSYSRIDEFRSLLRIGLVKDAEVTDVVSGHQLVSQAFCSALPIAYSPDPSHPGWCAFARLILEATYEATLLAARSTSPRCPVLLTAVGGGVFGNPASWIEAALRRALGRVGGLDARLVSYTTPPDWVRRLAYEFPRA